MKAFLARHAIVAYFILAFAVSWGGVAAAAVPAFARGEAVPVRTGMLMLLAMLAGPSLAGLALTAALDGRSGLAGLFARMNRWRVGGRWYAALLIPPVLILAVLLVLSAAASRAFLPALVPLGIFYGILSGYFEEIGWSGFAYPRMRRSLGPLRAAIVLGVVWGVWHVLAGYLGASAALGRYWLPNFLALWLAGMTAMRVLISWIYVNTGSVRLCQLMHMSSTGSLAVLGPPAISPAMVTSWYAIYAAVLWIAAAVVIAVTKGSLTARSDEI